MLTEWRKALGVPLGSPLGGPRGAIVLIARPGQEGSGEGSEEERGEEEQEEAT